MSLESGTYSKGLEGIIADETTVCRLDGPKGRLYYRGYAIEDLARSSDFEEVTYLLLNEKLPSAAELAEWRQRMRASRGIPRVVNNLCDKAMLAAFVRESDEVNYWDARRAARDMDTLTN